MGAKTAQAAHVTAGNAPPEPVNTASEFSATQPKAAAPMSPPSSGLGSAENHAAKAAEQVTASPAHPQPVKAAPDIQVTQPEAAASSGPATSAKVEQAAEHVNAGIASQQPVKAAPPLSATQSKASAAMSPTSPALGDAESHGARVVQPAEHVTAGTAPPQPIKPAPELSTTLPKAAAAMSPPSSGPTTTAGPGPSAGKAQQHYYKGVLSGRRFTVCCNQVWSVSTAPSTWTGCYGFVQWTLAEGPFPCNVLPFTEVEAHMKPFLNVRGQTAVIHEQHILGSTVLSSEICTGVERRRTCCRGICSQRCSIRQRHRQQCSQQAAAGQCLAPE